VTGARSKISAEQDRLGPDTAGGACVGAEDVAMPDRPQRPLTAEELATYDRDGVVHARGLFPPDWVERMARAVDEAVADPTLFGGLVSMPEQGFSGDLFLW
jgi:hypothetical protein